MDLSLPVWSIRPNWKSGILERLEWLTDVIVSEVGVEQRRSVRQSPRRSFEITVNPSDAERTFLDLVMHRLGSETWLFPLWHDQAVLGANSGVNTESLEIDTTFREFRDGDYAMLYRDAFTWEVVSIAEVLPGSLHLVGGPELSWPRGTKVYPLRRATVQTESQISALTSRVGQSTILFQLNEANDYPESTDGMILYDGSPLIDTPPNRSQEITLSHTRLYSEQDGDIGLRYRTDETGRAFSAQSHNWMVRGREDQSRFRSLLYYLRGQQRMVWLPTFNDDLFLTKPIAAGVDRADIRKVGLGYVGGPIPGRARFWTGKEVVLHAAMLAAPTPDEERLRFVAPIANAYTDRDAWSFLEPARLAGDTIEIQHHTDSDGVCEISTSFKTFANDRVAGMPIYLPTPTGAMSNSLCGEPGDAALNTCYVPPSDIRYYVKSFASLGHACNPTWDGNINLTHGVLRPNGPGGRSLDGIHLTTGETAGDKPKTFTIYELDVEGSPVLGGQKLLELILTDYNTFVINLYYDPPPGPIRLDLFHSSRYCGSVGVADGRRSASYGVAGQQEVFLGEQAAGGNGGNQWDWVV